MATLSNLLQAPIPGTHLQTSVREVRLPLPSPPVSRDTSRTRYPAQTDPSGLNTHVSPVTDPHDSSSTHLSGILIDVDVNDSSVFVAFLDHVVLDLRGPAGVVFPEESIGTSSAR